MGASPKCYGASAVIRQNPFTLEFAFGQNEVAKTGPGPSVRPPINKLGNGLKECECNKLSPGAVPPIELGVSGEENAD